MLANLAAPAITSLLQQSLLPPTLQPTISDMTKSGSKYTKPPTQRRTAKAATKLVAVKQAAQRPTHASRAVIRRVVRSVAAAQEANA